MKEEEWDTIVIKVPGELGFRVVLKERLHLFPGYINITEKAEEINKKYNLEEDADAERVFDIF